MENGNYGGAFVLTDEEETEVGTNYIAITTLDNEEKPKLEDFKKAEVYIKRVKKISFKGSEMRKEWVDQAQIGGFSALGFKNYKIDIEVIGKLTIHKDYKIRTDRQVGFGWIVLKSAIPFNNEYIKLNGQPKTKLNLREWM